MALLTTFMLSVSMRTCTGPPWGSAKLKPDSENKMFKVQSKH